MVSDTKAVADRISTYIEGLDELLGGGIPAGSVILVSGYPGTMKSSLIFSILHQNSVHRGARSVYVSLEQSGESLLRQMNSMHIDVEHDNNIRIIDLSGLREELEAATFDETLISVLKEYVNDTLREFKFDIFALDSLDVLEIEGSSHSRRSQIFFLFEWLRGLGLTSFIVSETNPDELLEKGYEEGYLSDGIIQLTLGSSENEAVHRKIRCIKMRNTRHETSFFSLRFDEGRFIVTQSIG